MRLNPWFPADLVTFTEEVFNGKLNFLLVSVIHRFRFTIIFTE